jgi:hypothetical protein
MKPALISGKLMKCFMFCTMIFICLLHCFTLGEPHEATFQINYVSYITLNARALIMLSVIEGYVGMETSVVTYTTVKCIISDLFVILLTVLLLKLHSKVNQSRYTPCRRLGGEDI